MGAALQRAVKIAGGGLVSALGNTLPHTLEALYQGVNPAREATLELFDPQLQVPYCGVSDGPQDAGARLQWLLDGALAQLFASHPLSVAERRDTALFIGSSCYGIGIGEQRYQQAWQADADSAVPMPLDGFLQISSHLRRQHQFCGPDFSFNTACTASANALLTAATAINNGLCRHALVVGLEARNETTLGGFHSMQLLAANGMRPFDRERNGLVLGEGCGVLLLTAADDDAGLQLVGGASQCDTYGISTSNPDGSTIAAVMQEALESCGLLPADILAIKAHGTATPLNDDSEAAGMRRLFADAIPPFFSLKAALGHTLGSCGAMETLLTGACLQHGLLPASSGFRNADPALGVVPTTAPQTAADGHYLLNFFGFGGNNCSLVLRHSGEPRHV
ncbi:beta-ketoacyl synthase N-terminal-like domain-containing protein [Pseudomaricurvus sp. HS19]|uniref:beta-ketoacyl synthase N-terminal-like domain-containing protein n=1 Tax=Pseudomaricurvus sp. HS19 TaxID=2692626 RepID=UPI00136FB012|nr:beta-ketoacyl synthase N-terminal-like domain-containing protein [Pseudomaricurvus sp. HS19]MYM63965.1 beta-ketoacyl synthase [Pseudomaricurvus sp. HS19]